jgi:hypothetical protein
VQSKDLIRINLDLSAAAGLQLIEDMKDAPLTAPTPNGGNHPLWVLGHLTYSEGSLINFIALGEEHPLGEWKDLFGIGSTPVYDQSAYPSMDDVLAKFATIRAGTLQRLDALGEDELDATSKRCPEGYEDRFGTVRLCFAMTANHWFMHRGQVADARRAAGRELLRA